MDDIYIGDDKKPGAKTFPNPDNARPQDDTEKPDAPKTSGKLDISNPPASDIEVHPLEKHFQSMKLPGRGYRHPVGGLVPKVSEN